MTFWSGHNVVAKSIIDHVPPFSFTFYRWTLASLLILPFAWPLLRADWPRTRGHWPRLLFIATTGITAFNTLLYVAVQTTSAVNVGLISSMFPVTIALFSWLLLKVRLRHRQILGMSICFVGVLAVILRGDFATVTGLVFVEGDLWMLAGVVCGALYPVLLHERPAIHPVSLLAILIILGALTSLPLLLIDLLRGQFVEPDTRVVLGMAYVGLFPSLLAYLFWNRGIALVGANRAGLFLNLVPILTAVMAWLFIAEALHWYHFLGLTFIIVGMLLFNLENLRPGPGANATDSG